MVVTVGAMNKKDVDNLYKDSEKTGGEKPIDLIKATRPILIVDEPQSVDGGLVGRGKEALYAMNPLCTLRYSATHVNKHHMVYRLDAVDAYERKLVKQVEVASATVDVDADAIQRQMIRRTIREHLDKEKRLRPHGIKVLSLFFIDAVERYRGHDKAGKGDYARIFEEEYRRLAGHADYLSLFQEVDLTAAAEEVHNDYFSIDRKGVWTDTAENNQTHRDNAERAYNLIMKEKEKLLSLEELLKFIFSHSALREGWDNPRVTAAKSPVVQRVANARSSRTVGAVTKRSAGALAVVTRMGRDGLRARFRRRRI